MPDDKTAFHDRYIEGWNDHDPETVMAQFADGGTYVDPLFDGPISGEEIGEFVRLTADRFPDFRFEQRRLLDVESDDVRIEEWTMHGTHEGMREGLPPTGNTIALEGVSVVELSAEGIESIRGYYDQQELTAQLGLTFPEVIGEIPSLISGAVRETL
ncbi:ester cyclase [Halobellus rubicundus]|uniref:Ester cyclase n=1 Tax=Halobellus rubicundus TaxID=2996466 RepID=A0ABD5MIM0_9EURY